MGDYIFSPDGNFMWTGSEWIPKPPKLDQDTQSIDNPGFSQIIDNILPDSFSEPQSQSLSISDSVIMGNISQVYNDESEIKLVSCRTQLTEILIKIEQSIEWKDSDKFYSEIDKIIRLSEDEVFEQMAKSLISAKMIDSWTSFSISKLMEHLVSIPKPKTEYEINSWYQEYRERYSTIDDFILQLISITSIIMKVSDEHLKFWEWWGVKQKCDQILYACEDVIYFLSSGNHALGSGGKILDSFNNLCLKDFQRIIKSFTIKHGVVTKSNHNKDYFSEMQEIVSRMNSQLEALKPVKNNSFMFSIISIIIAFYSCFKIMFDEELKSNFFLFTIPMIFISYGIYVNGNNLSIRKIFSQNKNFISEVIELKGFETSKQFNSHLSITESKKHEEIMIQSQWMDSEGHRWKRIGKDLFWWNGSEWVKHS